MKTHGKSNSKWITEPADHPALPASLLRLPFPSSVAAHFDSTMGFPGGSDSKESTCNAGDPGSTPGLGRSPGEGNDYLLQYSRLENATARGTWRTTAHRVAKSQIKLYLQWAEK